jgi:hypothetical protein
VFLSCCGETWQLWLLLHCCFLHNPVLEEIMQSRFATKAPTTAFFFFKGPAHSRSEVLKEQELMMMLGVLAALKPK